MITWLVWSNRKFQKVVSCKLISFCYNKGVPNWQSLKASQGCASSVTRVAKLLNPSPNVSKSAILGFGIWNTAQGIRKLTNYWNAESKCHWQRIQNPEPAGTRNPRFGTQNPRLSWIPLHGAKTQLSWHDVLVKTPFIFIHCIFKKSRLQFKVETKIVFHPWHYLQSLWICSIKLCVLLKISIENYFVQLCGQITD